MRYHVVNIAYLRNVLLYSLHFHFILSFFNVVVLAILTRMKYGRMWCQSYTCKALVISANIAALNEDCFEFYVSNFF